MKKLVDSLLTLGKVLIRSRRVSRDAEKPAEGVLIIMGNGPSLRQTIDRQVEILERYDTMAVNFAANTPDFFRLRPLRYMLADPHFFRLPSADPNVGRLWENLGKIDWEMTLHVPVGARLPELPENIRLRRFNMTPCEGYDALCHAVFSRRLGMPRPRNVLIPAIMEGLSEGYSDIYLVGADHTWPHTLYVDELNRVVSVQPHFYEDNKKELDRVAREYAGLHLHDVLGSMTVAFRSYHQIARYAEKRGVRIFNSTPGSLIDAFTRRPLPD